MSNNVHNIRKVCLETTLCVLACFVEFYLFVLNEIVLRYPKIVYKYIRVGNIRHKIPKEQPGVLEERPMFEQRVPSPAPNDGGNRRPIG